MITASTLNPVLSEIAIRMVQQPVDFVGLTLFPLFRTGLYTSQYYIVDDAAMVSAPPLVPRAPGAPFPRSLTKLSNDQYNTEQWAQEEPVGLEENAKYARPGAAMQVATRRLMRIILLGHEQRTMQQATGATVPNAAVAVPWTDAGSDPLGDTTAARKQIFGATGLQANVMTCPWTVFEALKQNQQIKDMIKISDKSSRWPELLAALFDVERFAVAKGVVNNANEGQAVSLSEVWADNVILAYVDMTEDLKSPSFGRTWIVEDERTPTGVTVEVYGDEGTKSGNVRALQQTAEKLTGPKCGFRLHGTLG
jgi:hypothetical protein